MNNAPGVQFCNQYLKGSFLHRDMQFLQWMIKANFALLWLSLFHLHTDIHIYTNFNWDTTTPLENTECQWDDYQCSLTFSHWPHASYLVILCPSVEIRSRFYCQKARTKNYCNKKTCYYNVLLEQRNKLFMCSYKWSIHTIKKNKIKKFWLCRGSKWSEYGWTQWSQKLFPA